MASGRDVALGLLQWFEARGLHPHIVGEFDDSALLKAFGQAGVGLFVAPTAIADYVCKQYRVESLGHIDSISEQLYAITTERKLTHPAIVAISQMAHDELFGNVPNSAKGESGATKGKLTPKTNTGRKRAPSKPAKLK